MKNAVSESSYDESVSRTLQKPEISGFSLNLESIPSSSPPLTHKPLSQELQFDLASSRSSGSSSTAQRPLLPGGVEQQDLSFSALPNYRAYMKRQNLSLSPISLFIKGWNRLKKSFRLEKQRQTKGWRHVEVNPSRTKTLLDDRTNKPYVGNWIRSNKYTPWTFVPRQLAAQFSKLANFYFLCFAIMQLIPGLSTTGNYTNIIPLMVFISISMAKEGFDDYRRHRLDKKENRRETFVIDKVTPLLAGALNWKKEQWRYLSVGDIIKVKRDEPIPADIALLSCTSLGEHNVSYVETMALDGETNLKRKLVVKSVGETCVTPEKLLACSIEFVAEDPNPNLTTFKGKVTVNGQTSPLTNHNILYRGSVLRNTSEITAIVLYSGEECKIRMNIRGNGPARIKAPRLQLELNRVVVLVVCLVLGLSIYNTLVYEALKSNVESLWYLSSAIVPLHDEIFGFIIMFGTMVPLSLYVSMEMIKLAQMFFLNSDVEMYDEISNTPFEARTSTINEELGQVTHIFSDKTGTLTDNEMEFRRLYVAGTELTHQEDEILSYSSRPKSSASTGNQLKAERDIKGMIDDLSQRPNSVFAHRARLMLLCMVLCHSCIPEIQQEGSSIDFQASSPDELALVRAAREMGFLMRSRDQETITLELTSPTNNPTRTETYEVLNVIEFSNERRRMSTIVRFPDGRICIICKGADSTILERLKYQRAATKNNDNASGSTLEIDIIDPGRFVDHNRETAIIEDCMQSVNKFASESLRILLYAYRFLDEQEYLDWQKVWHAATTSLSNQEKMVEDAAELIEVNFELAGATAIEDKLQLGVSESIDKLRRANIKIWMLTGDKRETAINIGYSCGLIKKKSSLLILDHDNGSADMEERMRSMILTIKTAAHSVVTIDGHTLATIYNDIFLEAIFFDLVVQANSVICCRAQPSQKAQLISGIRKRVPNSVTLAVGDGANDVAMIQEAHIGIGINGKEGSQAARSSDYSVAQFRFLQKLLLVHGRWNYVRTCKYVLGTLWKEVVFYLTQALFQRWNGFTGTSLYEPWSLTTFNTLFTSLPVLVIGIFEKDLAASTLLAVPELYWTMGPKKSGFNIWIYFGWTAMAVAESVIVYFCMLIMFAKAETTKDNTLFSTGDLTFVAVVIIISMKLQVIEMHNQSIIALVSVFLSAGAAFLWNIIIAATYPLMTPYRVRGGFFFGFGQNPTWWMTLFFIVSCVYILEIGVSAIRKAIFPTDRDIFQELEQDRAYMAWIEEEAASGNRKRWNKYNDEPVPGKNGVGMELQDLSEIFDSYSRVIQSD